MPSIAITEKAASIFPSKFTSVHRRAHVHCNDDNANTFCKYAVNYKRSCEVTRGDIPYENVILFTDGIDD